MNLGFEVDVFLAGALGGVSPGGLATVSDPPVIESHSRFAQVITGADKPRRVALDVREAGVDRDQLAKIAKLHARLPRKGPPPPGMDGVPGECDHDEDPGGAAADDGVALSHEFSICTSMVEMPS